MERLEEILVQITGRSEDFMTWEASCEGYKDGLGGNEEEAIGDFMIKNKKKLPFKLKIDKLEFMQ